MSYVTGGLRQAGMGNTTSH